MSSFTGLFSQEPGGETHIVTDPRKLPRIGCARLGSKVFNTIYDRNLSSVGTWWYYQQFSDHIALADVSVSNTYTTLLNVSNSNGGFLHFILSPGVNTTNPTTTVRITVDGGDAYEFSYDYRTNNYNYARMIIGGGCTGTISNVSSGFSGLQAALNPYEVFGSSDQGSHGTTQYDDPTNKVYGIGIADLWYHSDFTVYDQLPTPRLRFNSSLLIEVKQQVLNTGQDLHKSMCFYTLH